MLAEFTTKIRRTHWFMNSNETAVIPLSFQEELTEKTEKTPKPGDAINSYKISVPSAVLAWLLFLNKREVAQHLK
jgi:hypothetical protein